MQNIHDSLRTRQPLVVGSFGETEALLQTTSEKLRRECDVAEIRLDLFQKDWVAKGPSLWSHLKGFPLMFTIRSHREGSPFEISESNRSEMLLSALPDASVIDLELGEIANFNVARKKAVEAGIPWIGSFHNFTQTPSLTALQELEKIAKVSSADCVKIAVRINQISDLQTLATFQSSDSSIAKATMGMGDLAPVSRQLCAQYGSVFNYGYVGNSATAPGQWSARRLKDAIMNLQTIER